MMRNQKPRQALESFMTEQETSHLSGLTEDQELHCAILVRYLL